MKLFKREKTNSRMAKIRRFVLRNPSMGCIDIASHFKTDVQTVYNARHSLRKRKIITLRHPQPNKTESNLVVHRQTTPTPTPTPTPETTPAVETPTVDMVNSPPHYKVGGIETIDYIAAKLTKEEYRGYLKGNILKYGSRVGHKGRVAEDAGKLAWYATRLAELGE